MIRSQNELDIGTDTDSTVSLQSTNPGELAKSSESELLSAIMERENVEMKEVLKRLDYRQPVARVAKALLDNQRVPSSALLPVLETVSREPGANWRDQELSCWILGRVDIKGMEKRVAAEALLPMLAPSWASDKRHILKLSLKRALMLSIPISTWVYYFSDTLSPINLGEWWKILLIVPVSLVTTGLLMLFCYPITAGQEDNRRNRVRAMAIRSLGKFGLAHGVDGIAAAAAAATGAKASSGSLRVREAARDALPSLLSSLSQKYYGRLAPDTPVHLCKLLLESGNPLIAPIQHAVKEDNPLILPILRAIEIIGDARCLPILRTFIKDSKTEAHREEAEKLLPILVDRQRIENNPNMLLRASGMESASPQTLLRPATPQEDEDSGTLLRPQENSE